MSRGDDETCDVRFVCFVCCFVSLLYGKSFFRPSRRHGTLPCALLWSARIALMMAHGRLVGGDGG